jgi:membrane protease YdiL (CAAX protease family)
MDKFSLWPWFAFTVGVVLGWLTFLSGSWFPSAVSHGLINYLNLMFVCRGSNDDER